MTTTVGVKLDDETRDRLKSLGEMKQRSGHWLMRQAIQDYVESEERRNPEADETWLKYKHLHAQSGDNIRSTIFHNLGNPIPDLILHVNFSLHGGPP